MKSISFKNFRRFADFPEFKFGDITILVGGNNAGKSTLIKALILLVDNMKELKSRPDDIFEWDKPMFSFDMDHIHQLNLGTLGRALRIGADEMDDELTFSATIGDFKITFYAGNGTCDLNSPMSPVSIKIEDLKRNVIFNNNWAGRMSVEFKDHLSDKKLYLEQLKEEISKIKRNIENTEDLSEIVRYNEKLEKLNKIAVAKYEEDNEISSQGTADVETNNYLNLIVDSDYTIPSNPLARMIYQWVGYQLTKPALNVWQSVNMKEDENLGEEHGDQTALSEISEVETSLNVGDLYEDGNWLTTKEQHIANHSLLEDKVVMLRTIAQDLNDTLNRLNDFDEVYYIQAHAITQRVLYTIDNRNDYMAQVLHKFSRENILKGSEADRFLCKWLSAFGIGVDYKVKSIEGEGYTLEIETKKGTWQHLADLGMGSNQLVSLLVELSTLLKVKGNRQYPFIIVEEPEQNLHPRMQSKLADLFEELSRTRGFKFLVETHSEYLIRRTQVLVAGMSFTEEEIKTQNPFKVYYFDPEKGPYDMIYQTNGHFEEAFGEGFFDEAGKWSRELIRKKRT